MSKVTQVSLNFFNTRSRSLHSLAVHNCNPDIYLNGLKVPKVLGSIVHAALQSLNVHTFTQMHVTLACDLDGRISWEQSNCVAYSSCEYPSC